MRYDLSNDNLTDPSDDFFLGFPRRLFDLQRRGSDMRTDVVEHDDNYQVSAELPGFKKDGIHLNYRRDTLSIQATHENNHEDKDEAGNVLRRERNYSNVSRSFYLPNVDRQQITANYDGGILKITLPKLTASSSDDDSIEIN